MKIFLRIVLILSIFFSMSIALDYKQTKRIEIKKDEEIKILVNYTGFSKLFKFRWTLFKNGGLVIHRSYDKVISQNILYTRHKNNYIKQKLKSKGANNYEAPYFLIKFKEFDYEKNKAIIELFLYDRDGIINLEYLDKKRIE